MANKILETKGLTVEFNGFKAMTDMNFSLKKGELCVILGPNGAGKTTFMDIITGKTKPTKGAVLFKGREITGRHPHEISLMGIGRKFQGPNIFDNMTVLENIEVSVKGSHRVLQSLFHRKSDEDEAVINKTLELIGLKDKKKYPAHILSHGEKQWLEIGMLLAQDPELIILDEPTTGMTADETFKTGELVMKLIGNGERTVLVVEHDMEFVRQIAKDENIQNIQRKVTVFHQGKFLAEGSLKDIEENPKVQEVYLKEDVDA